VLTQESAGAPQGVELEGGSIANGKYSRPEILQYSDSFSHKAPQVTRRTSSRSNKGSGGNVAQLERLSEVLDFTKPAKRASSTIDESVMTELKTRTVCRRLLHHSNLIRPIKVLPAPKKGHQSAQRAVATATSADGDAIPPVPKVITVSFDPFRLGNISHFLEVEELFDGHESEARKPRFVSS